MGLAWPNETAARARAYNARLEHVPFFKFNGADDATMRRLPQIFQKNIWRITYISRRYIACSNPKFDRCDSRKNKVRCFITQKSHFHPTFGPKYLENTLETVLNQFIATKKPKNLPKPWNPPGTKILPELRSIILGVCKVKKKNILHNSYHHMEPFNTKINYFGGHNLPRRPLSLSRLESSNSLSLLPTKKDWKKK
jgi:hypothetical protein